MIASRCARGFALAAVLLLLAPTSALAVNYGDFTSDTVEFLQVTDFGGGFGTPTTNLDTLDFNPSIVAGPGGLAFEQLNFTVRTLDPDGPGPDRFLIDQFIVDMDGIANVFTGTSVVDASVTVDITETNLGGTAPVNSTTTPYNQVLSVPGGTWNNSFVFDVGTILGGFPGFETASATEIQISILITLNNTGAGVSSLTNTEGMTFTFLGPGSVVPEPSTGLLLSFALGGLGIWRRHDRGRC
ncbi:MAG: PEP-CTERM sorting domain-containing protein [Myxococcota bacterium]